MASQQITIDGSSGVSLIFKNKERGTFYEIIGKFTGTIDESTTLEDLQINNEVRLLGFAVMPEITDNPYIGGFEEMKPIQPLPPQPPGVPGDSGFILNVLPCASEKATVSILNEGLTRKQSNTVEFQLLLFSLTYVEEYVKEGRLAMCDYDLIGEDGKMYVSMRQKEGAICGSLGGECPNNHPRFEDNVPGIGKYDCKVYLPKQDYKLRMWNTGQTPIKAWVHHPGIQGGDVFVSRVEQGRDVEVFISKKEFNGQDYENAIKINGNCVYDM